MPSYLQDELKKQFDHVVEECGEFIAAYGKMSRWGAFSVNPELDPELQETNIDWVRREMKDITKAITRTEEHLRQLAVYQADKEPLNNALHEAFPLYD